MKGARGTAADYVNALASPLVDDYRSASLNAWSTVAPDWAQLTGRIDRQLGPAADWIIDALALQPGQSVLELAGGPGTLSMMAARAVGPSGPRALQRLRRADGGRRPRAAHRGGAHLGRVPPHRRRSDRPPRGFGRCRGLPDGLHADGRTGGGAARDRPRPEGRRQARARRVGRRRAPTLGPPYRYAKSPPTCRCPLPLRTPPGCGASPTRAG